MVLPPAYGIEKPHGQKGNEKNEEKDSDKNFLYSAGDHRTIRKALTQEYQKKGVRVG
jgi:hypothetical protein